MSEPIEELSRLCIHTITTKPWSIDEALDQYTARGIRAMSVWQNAIEGMGAVKAGERIRQYHSR